MRATVVGGVAIVVAIGAGGSARAQPGATEPTEPTEELAPPVARPRVVHALDREDVVGPWGGGVTLMGLSGIGALPGVNIGGEVGAFLRHEEIFGGLALGRWRPQEPVVLAETPQRVELGLDVWSFRVGWASRSMPLRAWVLAESGELATERDGGMSSFVARMIVAIPSKERWTAVGGGFSVAWPMADYARLVGTIEFAVPLAKKTMMLETGRPYETGNGVARANFGLELGWR